MVPPLAPTWFSNFALSSICDSISSSFLEFFSFSFCFDKIHFQNLKIFTKTQRNNITIHKQNRAFWWIVIGRRGFNLKNNQFLAIVFVVRGKLRNIYMHGDKMYSPRFFLMGILKSSYYHKS